MIPWIQATMLYPKTTIAALIAALSVLATTSVASALIPQASAFIEDDNNDDGNTVDATQSNSATTTVTQTQNQEANDNDFSDVNQQASQEACIQINQQNAAAGDDATNVAENEIETSESAFSETC